MRLDKFIASQTGLSRSQAHKEIRIGQVSVNGEVVKKVDFDITAGDDTVLLNGKRITYSRFLYIMMNKPKGVVSASRDSRTQTVLDLLPRELKRSGLFPAGRLDKDTEGLLIITDDGDMAHRMLAPGKGVFKTYIAVLDAPVTPAHAEAFAAGMEIDGGERCLPAELTPIDGNAAQVKICEGKFHQIKRMFKSVGRQVVELKRIAVGALRLDETLKPGESRLLSEAEIAKTLKND